jgi:hypothetical protein
VPHRRGREYRRRHVRPVRLSRTKDRSGRIGRCDHLGSRGPGKVDAAGQLFRYRSDSCVSASSFSWTIAAVSGIRDAITRTGGTTTRTTTHSAPVAAQSVAACAAATSPPSDPSTATRTRSIETACAQSASSAGFTSSIGTRDRRTSASATLPSHARLNPPRPCVLITIRSTPCDLRTATARQRRCRSAA